MRAKKREKRFKLRWENRAKALLHLGQKGEEEIVYGPAATHEWSRSKDKKEFHCLAKSLEIGSEGDMVLDVGCGPLARAEVQFGLMKVRVVGLDVSRTIIARAKEYTREFGVTENVNFVVGDAEFLPLRKSVADAVICIGVISHLPSVSSAKRTVKEMARVTNRNGVVRLNFLQNLYSVFGLQESIILRLLDSVGVNRVQLLLFKGLGEIQEFFNEAGLEIREIQYVSPIGIPAFDALPTFIRKFIINIQSILDKSRMLRKFSRTFDVTACRNN